MKMLPILLAVGLYFGACMGQEPVNSGATGLGPEALPRPEGHFLKKIMDPKLLTAITMTLGLDKVTDWILGTNKDLDQLLGLIYFVMAIVVTTGFAILLLIVWCVRKDRRMKRLRGRNPGA